MQYTVSYINLRTLTMTTTNYTINNGTCTQMQADILRQDAFLVTEMHDGTYETTYHNLLILRKICI